jgi:hypothetical protein
MDTNILDSRHIPNKPYWVNTRGHVYSEHSDIIMKGNKRDDGYITVDFFKDRTYYVHLLVAEAFPELIENNELHNSFPDIYSKLDHKDNVRSHNWASNLRWCSDRQNAQHRRVNKNNKLQLKNIEQLSTNSFRVRVTDNNGRMQRKIFKTVEEAVEQSKIWRREFHGKFYHD